MPPYCHSPCHPVVATCAAVCTFVELCCRPARIPSLPKHEPVGPGTRLYDPDFHPLSAGPTVAVSDRKGKGRPLPANPPHATTSVPLAAISPCCWHRFRGGCAEMLNTLAYPDHWSSFRNPKAELCKIRHL